MKGSDKMRIAVCDDSSVEREITISCLKQYFIDKDISYNIKEYKDGKSLINDIQEGCFFDIIILDIIMHNMFGNEVAKELRNIKYNGKIIFLTSAAEYVFEGYEVSATAYLLKSNSFQKMCEAMDRAINDHQTNVYRIIQRTNIVCIPYNEILFIESENSKCIIHRTDNNTYTVYKKLDKIENELNDKRFLRSHQSYLVNMDFIIQADKVFLLKSGEEILIRQRNLKNIRQNYIEYLKTKKS